MNPNDPQQPTPATYAPATDAGNANAAWFCGGIGILILLVFPRTFQWLGSVLFKTSFTPFQLPDGTIVPYPKTSAFWSDLGPTTLGLVLLTEAATLLARHRALQAAALVLIAGITLYNLVYFVLTISSGLAVMSALEVLVGVPIIIDLSKRLRVRAQIP